MRSRYLFGLMLAAVLIAGLVSRPAIAHDDVQLVVPDQAISDGYVLITHIYAHEAGWITIQNNDDAAGNPVIGKVYIPQENSFHLLIPVDMNQVTPVLVATVHLDKGEPGKFEYPGPDIPDTHDNGDILSSTFKVIGISVKDQFIDTTKSVTIDHVIAQEAGSIAIHADGDGAPIIGSAPIKAGVNTNITIPIDPSKATPELKAVIQTDQNAPATLGNTATNEPFWTSDHVRVIDQLAGSDGTLVVPAVLARNDGWLAIQSSENGNPTLGTAPIKAGLNANVSVKLQDPSSLTNTVIASLHIDQGVVGKYEYPGPDSPVKDANGADIAPSFLASNGVIVSDQKIDEVIKSGSVMIDSVVAARNGWIAVHSNDKDNPVIGVAYVHAGANPQVQVMVSTDYITDTVQAQLYIDAGQPGTYELPDPDTPVKDANGNDIAPSLKIEGLNTSSSPPNVLAAGVGAAITLCLLVAVVLMRRLGARSS